MPHTPAAFADYAAFAGHLDALGLFRMRPGLERIRAALEGLGATRLPGLVVQVLGTNGKGSTAAFLAAIARAHGVRTLLYTSPHFLSPRERIKLDGRMLPEAEWTDLANEVMARGHGADLTYFELLTAMAGLASVRHDAGLVILEAGLGGTWDATTAFERDLALFCPVSLDHTAVLGDTLAAIAHDKAGALQGVPAAVTGAQPPEALEAIRRRALEFCCVLHQADGLAAQPAQPAAMAGPHQAFNAHLAVAAFRLLAPRLALAVRPDAVARGLRSTVVPGRLQRIPGQAGAHPDLILDAAHNPDGMHTLSRALAPLPAPPRAVVFGCLSDKDVQAMARELARLHPERVLVPQLPESPRTLSAVDLATALRAAGLPAEPAVDTAAALRSLPEDAPVLVCGSIYLLAEVFRLRPECLEPGMGNMG